MSQGEKARYFRALKDAGVEFDRHYREYKTEDLKAACDQLVESDPALAVKVGLINPPPAAEPLFDPAATQAAMAAAFASEGSTSAPTPRPANVLAGMTPAAVDGELEVLRIDEFGREWLQEEVLKPSIPKPRGRRVLTYMDPGSKMHEVRDAKGSVVESFEIPGDPANAKPMEVKITLPSYQVGIYRTKRFPFKVHVYNGLEGFDLFEVQNFYGGAELVPQEIKRIYVENVLCYDIRTTVRAIQTEFRQQQLAANRGA